MSDVNALYSWRPFRAPRDIAISTLKYGKAWLSLMQERRSLTNFGDEVSAAILQELTNLKFRSTRISRADFVGVGSALNVAARANFNGTVIGTGLRRPLSTAEANAFKPTSIIGVRGHLTAENLGLEPSLAIGDPGLIVSDLYPRSTRKNTSGPLLVPHFEVYNLRETRMAVRRFRNAGWEVMPPNAPPQELARKISQASFVGSSSLHGFIFAHSYGVPTQLIRFDAESREPGFKFNDYLSVFKLRANHRHYLNLLTKPATKLIDQTEEETSTIAINLDGIKNTMYSRTATLRTHSS